ncbi:lipopolysaccharide biosynthesis protein [Luedemannella helvata]|uniref:Uncharacterized protein n=1 Tax=Luedemannella helvata TaxID=349315 RepID=A0ABN2JS63_9ACTN
MESARPAADLNDYIGMAKRHWLTVLGALLVGVTGAAALAAGTPKEFASTTSVLVQPVASLDANVVGGRTRAEINLDTEAQLVRSNDVSTEAATLLRGSVSPQRLATAVSVDVPPNTAVLRIRFHARTAVAAQAGSHAFAEAYLHHRQQSAQREIDGQMASLDSKIKALNSQLGTTNRKISEAERGSAEMTDLRSRKATLTAQITNMSNRLNQFSVMTAEGGRIITDAALPGRPTKPDVPLYLGSGAVLGLLLGLFIAICRQRFDGRVRQGSDLPRRAGVPLLAALDDRLNLSATELCAPHTPGGRVFNRLRNEVLATLTPDDQVIVISSAHPGAGSTLVAANLADALARSGSEVVLVSAHAPDLGTPTTPLTDLFRVAGGPGFTDVLAGRATLTSALQPTQRNSRLSVITTGGTATAAGLLQGEDVRTVLTALCDQTEYVVIDAPSTASSADAQSLAGLADAAIITAERDTSRIAEVADAAQQFARVGTPLLGGVLLPTVKLAARPVRPTQRPAPAHHAAAHHVAADDPTLVVDLWDEDPTPTGGLPTHAAPPLPAGTPGDDAPRTTR